MTHPGVGPTTALAFVVILDSAERFACGKQIASYVGLIPCEDSSSIGGWDILPRYTHLAMRRERRIAKVAMARKLAVRLYWMMRKAWNYEQLKKFGSYAGESDYVHGVQ